MIPIDYTPFLLTITFLLVVGIVVVAVLCAMVHDVLLEIRKKKTEMNDRDGANWWKRN